MTRFPKTLITGADGMVGSYLRFGIKLSKKELDVTDLPSILAATKKYKPRVIIHLAALTDVDYCERYPDKAYMVNAIGTYSVALAAREAGAKLVYISTAGIFDGKKKGFYDEDDLGRPQNHYGHSKYAGELIVQSMLDDFIIARTCWVFGGGPQKDKKFVAKIISQLDGPEIKALDDSFGSPTSAKDLASALERLILENARGVFHLAGKGQASRFDVAKLIVKTLRPKIPVLPVPYSHFTLAASRAKNESLRSKTKLMRPWKGALVEYLKTEWKSHLAKNFPSFKKYGG